MAQLPVPRFRKAPSLRYVRELRPLHFPERETMPESKTHLVLRTFLFRLLRFALGPDHSVGSEQFIYWNAADPTCCLAPDAFVRLGVRDTSFKTWKTWEQGGAPDLAVEIVSESDRPTWDEKLQRYHELGVRELVRFDPNAATALRIRVCDLVCGDLVGRENDGARTPFRALVLPWMGRAGAI